MPSCKVCGAEVTRFIKSKNSWWDWCSAKCMGVDPDILKKKQETNNKKFGSHPMQSTACKEKQKQTVLANYGVDNPSKSESIKQKMRDTFVQNYGVDNPSKASEVKEKIKESAIKRFANKKSSILEKRKQSCLEKYGVTTNKHTHIPNDSLLLMKDLNWLLYQHKELQKPCEQIAKELGISPTPILTFLAKNGIEVTKYSKSQYENEIVTFIKSVYSGKIEENVRSIIPPYEIDIWLPELNLAIEVNGVYWHSEKWGKDRNYHINKTLHCEAQRIHLIQLYDSEWRTKEQIIKSKLQHLLNKSTKIYARKCVVKEVASNEAANFLNDNHIQGACPSKIKIGLYHNNELYALATFGKPRFNKTAEWELLRFCNKNKNTVVGGLSKLLTYFVKTYSPTSIISYADRRWASQLTNVYQKTGFELIRESPPNYKYFYKNNIIELLSRNQFQKHLLSSKLAQYNNLLSEYENMCNNGYDRIWDSGNLVFKWKANEKR